MLADTLDALAHEAETVARPQAHWHARFKECASAERDANHARAALTESLTKRIDELATENEILRAEIAALKAPQQ